MGASSLEGLSEQVGSAGMGFSELVLFRSQRRGSCGAFICVRRQTPGSAGDGAGAELREGRTEGLSSASLTRHMA